MKLLPFVIGCIGTAMVLAVTYVLLTVNHVVGVKITVPDYHCIVVDDGLLCKRKE